MAILLSRVDERLVHGEVIVGVVLRLDPDCILVVDGAVAADDWQRSILESLSAAGPEVGAASPEDTRELLRGRLAGKGVVLVFQSLAGVLAAVQAGIPLPEVELRNIHGNGGRRLSNGVSLSPEDEGRLGELVAAGVRVTW